MSSESSLRHEVDKLKGQIKQFKREHEEMVEELEEQERKSLRNSGRPSLPPTQVKRVESMKSAMDRAFSDPGLPEHLQPVEKSDKEDLERAAARRARRLASEQEFHQKSSETVSEWQQKANKVQRKMRLKQERRLSFTETVESPNSSLIEYGGDENAGEDYIVDLLPEHELRRRRPSHSPGGTPSKQRREHQATSSGVGRRALIVIIVVEAIIIAGLTGATAYFGLTK